MGINDGAGPCDCGCGNIYAGDPIRTVQVSYQCTGCKRSGTQWDCLEPIMPEGNKVVSWSECLWQPSHLKEDAGVNQYS